MNERIKNTIAAQMQHIQDMVIQPKLSFWEINELYKHLGMMRMADIILRHDFEDESMHAKLLEAEALLEKAAKRAEQQVHADYQRKCDVEDVLSYAENEYGECGDPKVARKVKENADEIAREYRHAMDNDESWFYVLENVVESWLEDNGEV